MYRVHRGEFWGQPHQKWGRMECLSCLEIGEVWKMWKIWVRRRSIPLKPLFSRCKRPTPGGLQKADFNVQEFYLNYSYRGLSEVVL